MAFLSLAYSYSYSKCTDEKGDFHYMSSVDIEDKGFSEVKLFDKNNNFHTNLCNGATFTVNTVRRLTGDTLYELVKDPSKK